MRVLIIGYGSIGSKHFKIIKKNFKKINLFILSKRKIFIRGAKVINSLTEAKKIKPHYIIFSSETNKHYYHLKYLEKNLKDVKILVEKPLFDKEKKITFKNNKIFVGYNLRFHPSIIFLKNFLKKNKPIDIKIITNSYLPKWRKVDYSKSYSSNRRLGGGVILDLSHEIDLAIWLFGKVNIKYKNYSKLSKLNINTEDNLQLFGKIKKTNFYLSLNYYSKNESRNIYVDTIKSSLNIDLKNNIIKINNKYKKNSHKNFDLDKTYLNMHQAILSNVYSDKLCTFKEGAEVLKLITKIKK